MTAITSPPSRSDSGSADGPAAFHPTSFVLLILPFLLFLSHQAAAQIEFNGPIYFEDQAFLGTGCGRDDNFGCAIALVGDVLLVGAEQEDDFGESSGAVFVFRRNAPGGSWVEEAKLVASDGAEYDYFGRAVALSTSGDVAAIGSICADATATNAGAIYIFRYDPLSGAWTEEAKLLASDAAAGDFLGSSVALRGNRLAAGAYGCDDTGDDANGNDSGSAWAFDFSQGLVFRLDPCPIVAGQSATFSASGGTPDAEIYLAYSTTGMGRQPIPGLAVVLNLKIPQNGGARRTDSQGVVSADWFVRPGLIGLTLWFQTVQYGQVSNVMETTVH